MATYSLLENPRGKRGKKSSKRSGKRRAKRSPTSRGVSAKRRAAAKKAARTRKRLHLVRVSAGKKAAKTRKMRASLTRGERHALSLRRLSNSPAHVKARSKRAWKKSGIKFTIDREGYPMAMPVYTPASHQLEARHNPGKRGKKKGTKSRAAKRVAKRGTKRSTPKRGVAALSRKVSGMDKRLHRVEKDVKKIDHRMEGLHRLGSGLRSRKR